ncbi:MAG: ABC transporter ATP-binding protein [Patescibacteria group bacterium]
MKLLLRYLKQHKKVLGVALLLAAINQIFSLLDPQIFRLLIDNYATQYDTLGRTEFLQGIVLLVGAAVGVAMVSRIAKAFQDYFVNVVTERLGTQLYADAVDHSFSLPYEVFEDQRSGETLLTLEKARDDAKALIASAINVIFLSFVGVLFVLIYAFTVHWSIGAVYALMIPLLGTLTYFISKSIKKAQQTIVAKQADLAGATTETLRNVQLVKSLGLVKQEVDRLNNVNTAVLELELVKVKLVRRLSFLQGTLVNALRSTLMLLMLWLIFIGAITLGEFFSLLFYSFFIFNPLQQLGEVAKGYRESQASMQRLQEILKKEKEEKPLNADNIETLQSVVFKDVGLQYQSHEDPSVSGLSLEIAAGQTVAFVGPSGAGKSTIIKLLVGLYKPTTGTLKFNDIDASHIDFVSLRRRIGLVAQETQLFAGTIKDNLLFVRPDASDEECLVALKAAAADKILERSTSGLDTKIGEGGIKLSGGERQRLAIARALLRRPQMLIFDEATSSLDSLTEKAITDTIRGIEESHPDLIRVLVAHRLSTVMHADTIIVLEKGAIAETGTHETLLSQGGLYAALWRQQSAG